MRSRSASVSARHQPARSARPMTSAADFAPGGGVSPRGAQGLFRAVQAHALVAGRPFATPDDVKKVAPAVLAHRVLASATGRYEGTGAGRRERETVQKILDEVAVPL